MTSGQETRIDIFRNVHRERNRNRGRDAQLDCSAKVKGAEEALAG
jgi:hypothetical protein